MVLLVIRSKDLSHEHEVKQSEFDRAQFRLIDDETNQTIDQQLMKNMAITLPTFEGEGDDERQPPQADDEDEDDAKKSKPQNIIIMGRVALNGNRWIYERYNYMFKEGDRDGIFEQIGAMESESRNYFAEKEAAIKEEQKLLIDAREAAAQAAAAKAAGKTKKKGGKEKPDSKNKKKDDKDDDDKVEEVIVEQQAPDFNYMPGFKQAVEGVYSTVFGPLTID